MLNKKFKNLLALWAFALSSFCIFAFKAQVAEAHVLQIDNSIGAVLHIDPDDDPIIGKPATFFFDFSDRQKKFDPTKCDCKINIIDGQGKVLITSPLFQAGPQSGLSYPLFTYTFSQKGVYTIEAAGQPKNPGDFQKFDLKYPIRVARTDSATPLMQPDAGFFSSHWFHLGLLFLGLIIIWTWSFAEKLRGRSKNKKSNNNSSTTLKSFALLALFGLGLHTALICHVPELNQHGLVSNSVGSIQLPCCAQTHATVPRITAAVMPAVRIENLLGNNLFLKAYAPDNLINNKSPPAFSESAV